MIRLTIQMREHYAEPRNQHCLDNKLCLATSLSYENEFPKEGDDSLVLASIDKFDDKSEAYLRSQLNRYSQTEGKKATC